MGSGFSGSIMEDFQQNEMLRSEVLPETGVELPRENVDETLKQQLRILSLKDYLVRHYVKSLRAVPTKLEDTLEIIRIACTNIMAFEEIIAKSPVGRINNDFVEAVRDILLAVSKQENPIDVLIKVRISTETRLYQEGLGNLLHNT